jgi:hypothetical protein
MKVNMGPGDRMLRFLAGFVLLMLYFKHVFSGAVETIILVLFIAMFLTAAVGVCPFYLLFHINTNKYGD